jgi:hypothetical protein
VFLIAVFFAFCIHWQLTLPETVKVGTFVYVCTKPCRIVSVGSTALLKVVSLACHIFVSHKTLTEETGL